MAQAKVLEVFETKYASQVAVKKINILENSAAAAKYQVNAVPTLVFLDASGATLSKHVGYLDEDGLLKAWGDLGVKLNPAAR